MSKSGGRTRLGRFPKGVSGNPNGGRTRSRRDDWQNIFTGAGIFGKDKRVGANFALHQLSFDQLKDLWLGDDLAARAVETIPKEAMRQGYDVVISSSQEKGGMSGMDPAELASEITQKLDVLGADEYLEVAGNYERGYGGGAVLIGANDGQADLTQPLNLNKVRSIDWLTPLEARELMPLYAYADPRAPKFGQPEIYQLTSRSVLPSFSGNFASATMQIHESRLLTFPGIRVSRYQVTTARGGWGESVLSRVYRVLRDFNTAWSSAGVLVSDFAQSVIKIAGLWEALALDGNQAFANRLAAMEYGRSVVNAVTIDAGDDYSRQQTPLTGLPDLLEKFAVRLAAACDMPLTLLFGTSPAGMNATGESDVRFFYDRVAAYQKRKMEPQLRRLCQIIFRTIGNKREPDKWSVKFRPLWQDSATDRAAAMFTQAQADNVWIQAGVLSPEEVAASHWGKGEYDPNLSVDFEAREAQEAATSTPVDQAAINAMDPDHHTYQPPPEPGTAAMPGAVPAPGKPAAPDPSTRPKNIIQAEDGSGELDTSSTLEQWTASFARTDDAVNRNVLRFDGAGDLVLEQLAEDFPDDTLDWVRDANWKGPIAVDLDDIDYSNSSAWQASQEDEKVKKFQKRIRKGWMKPIVLVKRPGVDKLMIADGHHRAVAYKNEDMPAMAYIATVTRKTGPWDEFHSQQDERADQDRDEHGRFAGAGFNGPPSPAQAVARGGHERMAADHARAVAYHSGKSRELNRQAETHAKSGDWDKFAKTSREAIGHQAKAALAMAKVTYHAERAGTEGARAHAASAAASMRRHDDDDRTDEWSDAAREAAAEARKKGASDKAATAIGHATAAHELTAKANKTGKFTDHVKAAAAHEQASRSFERAGNKYSNEADAHGKAADEHHSAASETTPGGKTEPKGPVASAPDREHGPVPPPAGQKTEPAEGHGKPEGHAKEPKGKPKGGKAGARLKGALEAGKAAAEIVGGKTAGAVAEGVTPEIEGGEGEREKE